jgi:hypothetical protein
VELKKGLDGKSGDFLSKMSLKKFNLNEELATKIASEIKV